MAKTSKYRIKELTIGGISHASQLGILQTTTIASRMRYAAEEAINGTTFRKKQINLKKLSIKFGYFKNCLYICNENKNFLKLAYIYIKA